MSEPVANAVITKVDEDKRLVFGWASIIKDQQGKVLLDRQDDFIDDEQELEQAAYTYVLNSRDGGEMHIRKGVATMVESVVLSKEKQAALGIPEGTLPIGWWIGFRVNDDRVWEQVKKGDYAGFSVHGTGRREPKVLAMNEYTEVEKADKMLTCKGCGEKYAKGDMCKCGYMMKEDSDSNVRVSKRLVEVMSKAKKRKTDKVATVMREFDAGTLKTPTGEKVTSRRQALAIALSEQRRMGK